MARAGSYGRGLGDKGVEFGGEFEIPRGDAAGVMGGEVNGHAVVNVEPLGVVVHGLGYEGGAGHEAEGVDEVGELEFAVQFGVDESPAGAFGQGGLDFGLGEFGHNLC